MTPSVSIRREGDDAITKNHLKKRSLILALVKREVERLSAWRNPRNLAELHVPGEESISAWASQMTMTEKMWRESVRTAWSLCPRLAVHLASRLVNICGGS